MTNRFSIRELSNKLFYTADSGSYDDERWTSKGGIYTNRSQQKLLSALCSDWNDSHILEVGSGTARFTISLLRKHNHMTLADISPGMLATAKNNIEVAKLGDQVKAYVECSIYELPFEDGSFDHVLSLNVFNHLERPREALKQLARVVRPGSTLLFNYANLQGYYWPYARQINKQHKAMGLDVYSSWERPADMRSAIENAGLELVQKLGHVHVPRAMEKYPVHHIVRLLDALSHRGLMLRFAPFHFCLCRKK